MISALEIILFLRIFVAHILADFFLQRTKWNDSNQDGARSVYLYWHVAIVGILTYLLLGDWTQWKLPLFIMITHYLIDFWKSSKSNTLLYFLIDQLLHITMLGIAWALYINIELETIKMFWDGVNNTGFWIIFSSFLLILRPASFFIEKLTARWHDKLKNVSENFEGLNDAGAWIGYLERILILIFILVGKFAAIGFLIAAKVIRFNGNSIDEDNRIFTEYILIGTLLSFTLAILVGIAAVHLMK